MSSATVCQASRRPLVLNCCIGNERRQIFRKSGSFQPPSSRVYVEGNDEDEAYCCLLGRLGARTIARLQKVATTRKRSQIRSSYLLTTEK